MADSSTADADAGTLQRQLQEAREEADLTLEQLHLVQEELEVYFLRCEELETQLKAGHPSSANPGTDASPEVAASIDSLGRLMPLLTQQLSTSDLTALAHSCHRLQRHDLALPLLDAAVSRHANTDPALANWTQLQAVRTRLALGRRDGALRQLQTMADQQLAAQAVRHHTHHLIAWLALQKADIGTARQHLDQLEALNATDLDLAPLQLALQLASNPAEAPSAVVPDDQSYGASLDVAAISPDGRLLLLEGWYLDPSHGLKSLVLIRPQQLLPISPDQLDCRVRQDLAELQARQGLPATHPAGFTIRLTLAEEEAIACGEAETVQLALLRDGTAPIVIGRTATPLDAATPALYPLLASLLNNPGADPTDLSLWHFPSRC